MADDTFESRGINQVLAKIPGGDPVGKIEEFRTNGTDIKPAMVVGTPGESSGDIDPSVTTDEHLLGVVLNDPTLDIDTAFGDDKRVRVALKGSGLTVWCIRQANTGAVTPGMYAALASEAGKVRPMAAFNSTTPTLAGNTMKEIVGQFVETVADDASNDKLCLVRLSV